MGAFSPGSAHPSSHPPAPGTPAAAAAAAAGSKGASAAAPGRASSPGFDGRHLDDGRAQGGRGTGSDCPGFHSMKQWKYDSEGCGNRDPREYRETKGKSAS